MKKVDRVSSDVKNLIGTPKENKKTKKNDKIEPVKEIDSKSKSKKQRSFEVIEEIIPPAVETKVTADTTAVKEKTAVADKPVAEKANVKVSVTDKNKTVVEEKNSDKNISLQKENSATSVANDSGLKPVAGGLEPVIAPKGKVQLTPIVVPVAFVPYATQNQPLMQYDKNGKSDTVENKNETIITDQPLDKSVASEARRHKKADKFVEDKSLVADKKLKKKPNAKGRILTCAVLTLILNILFLLPVVLTKYAPNLTIIGNGTLGLLGVPNVIDGWINFSGANIKNEIPLIIFTIPCLLAIVNVIFAIVSLVSKKPFKFWISALIMTIVTLVGILLAGLGIIKGDMKINIIPFGANSGAYRLFAVALIFLIISLMYRYRPKLYQEKPVDFENSVNGDNLA